MTPVSQKLAVARQLSVAVWCAVFAILGALAGFFWNPWFYAVSVGSIVLFCYLSWLVRAQVRYLGWREESEELLVTSGKFFHTFTVVPYGRIQYVDVTQGPFQRLLGLKKVDINTASPSTAARIPGLLEDEADALRARLAERAREKMSGL